MTTQPTGSLFASDYTLTVPSSPIPARRPQLHPSSSSKVGLPTPSPERKGLDVVFHADGLALSPGTKHLTASLHSSHSGHSSHVGLITPPISPMSEMPPLSPGAIYSGHSPRHYFPSQLSHLREEENLEEEESDHSRDGEVDPLDVEWAGPLKGTKISGDKYKDYDSCMEGAFGHAVKASTYSVGSDKAHHHLSRADELFVRGLHLQPMAPRAMLGRANLLMKLAQDYQPPRLSIVSLQEAIALLRELTNRLAPRSIVARESLAQSCALLSITLQEVDDAADDEQKLWDGPVGQLAREALQAMEDVAADRMDRVRDMGQKEATEASPCMAEMFLALSTAAIRVSSFSPDLGNVDLHVELSEKALDQASNMATVASSSRVLSSSATTSLVTRVQLASGRSSLERLRHTFVLGVDLDEDDFRSLMADMSMLATECRERAAKHKGYKAAAAATLAWEAVQQYADAKVLYASLLRMVWRKRRPRRNINGDRSGRTSLSSAGTSSGRKHSGRSETIHEEDEEGEAQGSVSSQGSRKSSKAPQLGSISENRRQSISSNGSRLSTGTPRKTSGLDVIPQREPLTSFSPKASRLASGSFSLPPSGRRESWLPTGTSEQNGRLRRQSSMSSPLVGPDGVTAWSRKASIISLVSDDEAQGLVSSLELAQTCWELLDGAVKQYKICLTLLGTSDLPSAHLAKARTDTLTAIAYCSMFQASLSGRLAVAAEKHTSLLVTAEVYATWAAREVGWSFLVEGTQEAALADRRTNSWRADEAGKRAVMLLVRVWWHRAVTTESMDVETKGAAKNAVERVVKRMKEREGVKDGDVVRFKSWLIRLEGELDAAELLFWKSVSRILRGGPGFVMS